MPDQPYADAAPLYWAAGWRGVLPLPRRAKKHPPRGWTGADGAWPAYPDVEAWREDQADGNVALRLPRDVIGIDVDAYPGKRGAHTMGERIAEWGDLPPTWRSTARDDGLSGIILFRVPEGLRWPGELPGGDVEVIQYRHRYAVVWPSVHPDLGTAYRWYGPDDQVTIRVPAVDELADLPAAWVDGLTGGQAEADTVKQAIDLAGAQQWVTGIAKGAPCRRMRAVVDQAAAELAAPGSRHDAMTRAVGRVVRAADGGHAGGTVALEEVRGLFERATGRAGSGQRDADTARDEYARAFAGAIALVLGDPSPTSRPDLDPCADPFAGLLPPEHPARPSSTPTPTAPTPAPSPSSSPTPSPGPATIGTAALAADDREHQPAPAAAAELEADLDDEDHDATLADLDALLGRPTTPARPATAPTADTGRPETPTTGLEQHAEGDGTSEAADEAVALELARRQAAAQATESLRARRTAQRALDDEEHAAAFRVPPSLPTLAEELALPDDPVTYTVDRVMPTGGNVLLTAQYKAGKTTTMLNLIRALADGEPFLGEFPVVEANVGRVALWNYEVTAAQMRRWLRDQGIAHTDRVSVLNLRGYRVPLTVKRVEDWVVRWLEEHEVAVWIVDPFARAAVGSVTNENDNTEVGAFLDTLDVIKDRAGVRDLIMPTHTGRADMEEGAERARGATRLDDWADVRWLLTKDEHATRYFRATGRDVEVDESALYYRELNRELVLQGGNRQATRLERVDAEVMRVVEGEPGIGVAAMRGKVRAGLGSCSNDRIGDAVDRLVAMGRLRIEPGAGRRPAGHFPMVNLDGDDQ